MEEGSGTEEGRLIEKDVSRVPASENSPRFNCFPEKLVKIKDPGTLHWGNYDHPNASRSTVLLYFTASGGAMTDPQKQIKFKIIL